MKTAPQRFAWLAALTLLAWLPQALAVPTVKSLAGGPKSFNLNNYGYRDGATFSNAQFNFPAGMAINTAGTIMYVADRTNNAIRAITLPAEAVTSQTTTFPPTNLYVTNRISRPMDVVTDGANNVYVLNRGYMTNAQGVATNGSVIKFNEYGNYLGLLATSITNANAMAIDGATNLYVVNATNRILKIPGNTTNTLTPATSLIATVSNYTYVASLVTNVANFTNVTTNIPPYTNLFVVSIKTNITTNLPPVTNYTVVNVVTNIASVTNLVVIPVRLTGVAVLADGRLAVTDANPANSGVWFLDLNSDINNTAKIPFTGFNGTAEVFGTSAFATLLEPERIARAGGGFLVVTDRRNHRVKVITPDGTITNLYGVSSNIWITAPAASVKPGWMDGPGLAYPTVDQARAEAREPFGLCVSGSGEVYVSEVFYHLIRKASGTGLTGPGGINNGGGPGTSTGTDTNAPLPEAPTLSPSVGYFPMGQTIKVTSVGYANVFYTVDGTDPTTNSPSVALTDGVGYILWNNPLKDLSVLRVRAFNGATGGTNAVGQQPTNNTVGIPTGRYPTIHAGVGSTITVPVVATLRPSDTVKSFQFRVELVPNGASKPITNGFDALSVGTNEFVSVVTASQGTSGGYYSASPYNIGNIGGLVISAISSQSGVNFKNYAVVANLKIPIPPDAVPGDTYTAQIVQPTATSDAQQTPVAFNAGPGTTITVTNVSYIVGDCATSGWYNAGDFGDGNLANNDVNTIFAASLGLRVPTPYSDAYDCMDAFPEDATGFVGGDGLIRFLDWQITLDRALRLSTTNWSRRWDTGGFHANTNAILVVPVLNRPAAVPPGQVWYRQAALGGSRGASGLPGSTVEIPVFAKLVTGTSLSGLQFRAVATPDGNAPALTSQVQFQPSPLITSPSTASYDLNQLGCGWPLNSVSLPASSSNYLGKLFVTIPAGAQIGQTYTVTFANADGSPDLHTQYDFETRRVTIVVGSGSAPAPDQISDEWKTSFFGSVFNPLADPAADADGDGSSNFEEFLNGTNPTNALSRLQLTPGAFRMNGSQRQLPLGWLSAPGKIYSVERSTNPASGAWTSLGTYTGDGNSKEFLETNLNSSAQFYRVRVISTP